MKKQLIATVVSAVLLLQGCALIDVPKPGTRSNGCIGKCTAADRNFAIFQNVTLWLAIGLVGQYAVETQTDDDE